MLSRCCSQPASLLQLTETIDQAALEPEPADSALASAVGRGLANIAGPGLADSAELLGGIKGCLKDQHLEVCKGLG